ncbi:hypothetical protein QJQ45_017211 [Haematococcus lacustris]|nr:hypothetical protein QJQ45_017211 [Haematococcus lacustris]
MLKSRGTSPAPSVPYDCKPSPRLLKRRGSLITHPMSQPCTAVCSSGCHPWQPSHARCSMHSRHHSRHSSCVLGPKTLGTAVAISHKKPLRSLKGSGQVSRALPGLGDMGPAMRSDLTPEDLPRYSQMLSSLAELTSYSDLLSWWNQAEQDVAKDPTLVVQTFRKVAELCHTLDNEQLDLIPAEAVMPLVDAREEVCERLLPLATQAMALLPLDSMATCVWAASKVGEQAYSEGVDAAGVADLYTAAAYHALQPLAACLQPPPTDTSTATPPGPQSAAAAAAGGAGGAAGAAAAGGLVNSNPQEVLAMNIELLSGAFAAAGHYAPDLLQLLAEKAVQVVGSMEPGSLASLVEACHELQHYDRALLGAVGVQLLRPWTDPTQPNASPDRLADLTGSTARRTSPLALTLLTPEEAAGVVAAFTFFNVQNPAFFQVLLARASTTTLDALTPLQAEKLFAWGCMQLQRKRTNLLHMPCCPHASSPCSTTLLASGPPPPPAPEPTAPDSPPAPTPPSVGAGTRAVQELLAKAAERDKEQLEAHWQQLRREVMGLEATQHELHAAGKWRELQLHQMLLVLAMGAMLPPECSSEQLEEALFQPAAPDVPWIAAELVLPREALPAECDQRVCVMVLGPSAYCANDQRRLRGSMQSRIRALQLDWADQVAAAAIQATRIVSSQDRRSAFPTLDTGSYEAASALLAAAEELLQCGNDEEGEDDEGAAEMWAGEAWWAQCLTEDDGSPGDMERPLYAVGQAMLARLANYMRIELQAVVKRHQERRQAAA